MRARDKKRTHCRQVVTLNDVLRGSVRINEWDPSMGGCRQSKVSTSMVGVEALPQYRGGRFPSLPLPGQPFSFAGDTTLTTVRKPNGDYTVRVDRLFGDQSNEFTIINVLKEFPTDPPAATQLLGSQDTTQGDRVRIPYAFNDEIGIKHPSVSTQAAVYFAVSPSTAMFQAFQVRPRCISVDPGRPGTLTRWLVADVVHHRAGPAAAPSAEQLRQDQDLAHRALRLLPERGRWEGRLRAGTRQVRV